MPQAPGRAYFGLGLLSAGSRKNLLALTLGTLVEGLHSWERCLNPVKMDRVREGPYYFLKASL